MRIVRVPETSSPPSDSAAASASAPVAVSRPLFRIDPGWPFVLAGLALLVAGILIPAQRELHELRGQQAMVEATEARVYARLEAYDRFLQDLRSREPDLIRRLAIAHLNMVPKGEQSLLLTPGLDQTVAQWIDESVPPVQVQPEPYPDTLLGRLAVGPNRLWLLAASVFLLFVGMLLGPDEARPKPLRYGSDGEDADDRGPGAQSKRSAGAAPRMTNMPPSGEPSATASEVPADLETDDGAVLSLTGTVAAESVRSDTLSVSAAAVAEAEPTVIDVEVVDETKPTSS
jgi:hypothetical protein